MSWIKEKPRSWLENFCIKVLKCGDIPRHIAFIMDGNRRYAKKFSLASKEGHLSGFDQLTKILTWCRDLGIQELTFYVLSIENFKRSANELDDIMALLREKFQQLLNSEKEKFMKWGIRVRIIGKLDLLPTDVQKLVADIMISTLPNDKVYLNLCLAYTSRDEISTAIQEMATGVENGFLLSSDISEDLLQKCLYLSSEPDLLVRTSGEARLSDFLIWQSGYSVLAFFRVLWPQFNTWYMFAALLHYQLNCAAVKVAKQKNIEWRSNCSVEGDELPDTRNYAQEQEQDLDVNATVSSLVKYTKEKRVTTFLEYLHEKRQQYITHLGEKNPHLVNW